MNQHDLGDQSCMTTTEVDGKMRGSQRRRVPVAVGTQIDFQISHSLTLLFSVDGVEREKSNAVVILVMAKDAPTAAVLARMTANSSE